MRHQLPNKSQQQYHKSYFSCPEINKKVPLLITKFPRLKIESLIIFCNYYVNSLTQIIIIFIITYLYNK